jgi:glycosyltransferase involved in cell wall biosynthesis
MKSHKPKVSVISLSYNHETFSSEAIESVLNQTYQDFELIIIDDNSTDNNVNVLESFKDDRITIVKNEYNKGINYGMNKGIELSKGDYIVFNATDDVLEPTYIEEVLNTFNETSSKMIYVSLAGIDENSDYLDTTYLANPKSRSRAEIIRELFLSSNCAVSPGMAYDAEFAKSLIPLPNSLIPYSDYALHILIHLNTTPVYLNKELVKYRMNSNNQNVSLNNEFNYTRECLELDYLLDTFIQFDDFNLLKEAFPEAKILQYDNISKELIPFVLANIMLEMSKDTQRKFWAYKLIVKFLDNQKNFDLVNKVFNFTFKDLYMMPEKYKLNVDTRNIVIKKFKKRFKLLKLISILLLVFNIVLLILIFSL